MTSPSRSALAARAVVAAVCLVAAIGVVAVIAVTWRTGSGFWTTVNAPAIEVLTLIIVGAALLVALVKERQGRHRLEMALNRRVRFENLLSDLLMVFAKIPASRTGVAVGTSLRTVADEVGAEQVWLWDSGDPGVPEWTSLRLQSGDTVFLSSLDELPPTLRDKIGHDQGRIGSIAASPLDVGGAVVGALFWLSSHGREFWSAELVGRLGMISKVFASVLQRKHADDALEQSDRLKGAILSSLPAQVAVLDQHGVIIAVNDAWTNFRPASGLCSPEPLLPGANYLAAYAAAADAARGEEAAEAAKAVAGVTAVCEGGLLDFEQEYRCNTPDGERWFVMRVTPLKREQAGAVVTRWDVTERKHAEIALRESEDRFRRLADALPIGVWMAGADGAYNYFNKTWLELTGRSIEQEIGTGWLDAVHPDDRERCLSLRVSAVAAREPFSIDYRIRRHDGQYRWMSDQGVPRYAAGGTFLGYIGGLSDFTERRDAEQTLRALSGRLIGAQEEERRRIARELHDNVGQQLALLSIDIDRFKEAVPRSRDEVAGRMADLGTKLSQVTSDVHALSHRLHSSSLDALGLVAAVRGHCHEVSQHGVEVKFVDANAPASVREETALCLFRIAQEALTNVVKHSGARTARVTLSGTGSAIVLRVEDSGRGFEPKTVRANGLGLMSMRERLRSIGGGLLVRSSLNQGTAVEAWAPIGAAPSHSVAGGQAQVSGSHLSDP